MEGLIPAAFYTGDEQTSLLRIFGQLLHGLDRLSQCGGDAALEKGLIYCYIKISRRLLQRICYLSNAATVTKDRHKPPIESQIAKMQTQAQTQARRRKRMTKCLTCKERNLKCDQRANSCRYCRSHNLECDRTVPPNFVANKPTKETSRPQEKTMNQLCELLVGMTRQLDITKATHKQILEGYLFLLFEKIGHSLKQFVFNGHEDTISTAPNQENNDDLTTQSSQASHHTSQAKDSPLQRQAPNLIFILEQTQTFLHQQNYYCTDPDPPTPSTNVASLARDKLQHTLLKAIFGDRAPSAYEPALNRPQTLTDDELRPLAAPEGEVKDWYKHEVWRLLGWDVLRGHQWVDG